MRIDIAFLSPDRHRYRGKPKVAKLPAISITKDGKFFFNSNAQEMLGLRSGVHILFGPDVNQPRDWYVRVSANDGFLLLATRDSEYKRITFSSQALRQALLDALPHAPRNETLRFVLEEMPVTGPDDEAIWPLVTLPYLSPPPTELPAPPAQDDVTLVQGLYPVRKTVHVGQGTC